MSAKWSSISRLKDVQLAWMLDVVESRHAKLRTRVIAICLNFRTREAPVYQVLLQQGQVVKSLPSCFLTLNLSVRRLKRKLSLSSKCLNKRS